MNRKLFESIRALALACGAFYIASHVIDSAQILKDRFRGPILLGHPSKPGSAIDLISGEMTTLQQGCTGADSTCLPTDLVGDAQARADSVRIKRP